MVEAGYHTTLIVGRDYMPSTEWDMTGIDVIQIPSLLKYTDLKNDLKATGQLYSAIKRLRPAFVHTHLAKAGILGRIAAKLAGIKTVIHTVHGPTFPKSIKPLKRFFYWSLEKVCSTITDRFVFVGAELRDDYIKSRIAKPHNSVVIRSGRPVADFEYVNGFPLTELLAIRSAWGVGRESFVITYVARLVPSKAQEDAIMVLKLVREAGVDGYLMLVGEGHLQEEKKYQKVLENLSSRIGVADYVRFTGYQPDVLKFMKATDILVMTSKYEGLPNVAVEAGLCAKPLVAYNVCGLAEVIEDGKTGYIVNQGDIDGMASKISDLARNTNSTQKMGQAARARLEAEYNLGKMLTKKLSFYRDILSGR
jgi:glycosyltransferase involved in cell wall biosynthesis